MRSYIREHRAHRAGGRRQPRRGTFAQRGIREVILRRLAEDYVELAASERDARAPNTSDEDARDQMVYAAHRAAISCYTNCWPPIIHRRTRSATTSRSRRHASATQRRAVR